MGKINSKEKFVEIMYAVLKMMVVILIYLLAVCVCVYASSYTWGPGMPWCMCGAQRAASGSQFSRLPFCETVVIVSTA